MKNEGLNSIKNKGKLHFKQWSNKGFAAFCSLGKVIHISSLSVSVALWVGQVVEHIEDILSLCIAQEINEDADELQDIELLQAIPALVNAPAEYAKSTLVINKNINRR
ncbi:hypothetical protein [Plebeiibacterium marinum]|uniref:Uncharacterized protein n=1 Tax=Plebeiibacterium marinum TaxID=2992111 RepID=A0AAE3MIP2_9BACT|nr:hypothetical protein [Plebeiobacterium marinum]MCW3807797.1 hypothetical protein [Plebeiobacterium marinum]